jgi:divalent metal cation (Fe/Co/Zn/Cd) transporter
MKNIKFWKYSGIFLIATGILHTIVAIFLGKETFLKIIQDGLYNFAFPDYSRAFAVWFFICGIFIILLGQVLHHYIKKEQKPAPLSFGYSLLIFTIFGCIVEPGSGFWLFLPQALIIIFANKKQKI